MSAGVRVYVYMCACVRARARTQARVCVCKAVVSVQRGIVCLRTICSVALSRRCAQVGAIQSAVYEREAEATGSRQRAARLEHRLGELEAGLAAKVPLGPGPT